LNTLLKLSKHLLGFLNKMFYIRCYKTFIMRKSIEELRKLNTKNLLRYYKAERTL
jgi:hypothetical protein